MYKTHNQGTDKQAVSVSKASTHVVDVHISGAKLKFTLTIPS